MAFCVRCGTSPAPQPMTDGSVYCLPCADFVTKTLETKTRAPRLRINLLNFTTTTDDGREIETDTHPRVFRHSGCATMLINYATGSRNTLRLVVHGGARFVRPYFRAVKVQGPKVWEREN